MWRRQESIGILDAAFSGKEQQLGVDVVFGLVDREAESFGQVDGVVKYGGCSKGGGVEPCRFGHCARGAHALDLRW